MSQPSSSRPAASASASAKGGRGLVMIKTLVITMGVLIVAAVIALIIGLIYNFQGTDAPPRVAAPDKTVTLRLGLPENTRLRSMRQTRWGLALHVTIPGTGPRAGEWVYVVPLNGSGTIVRIRISDGASKE